MILITCIGCAPASAICRSLSGEYKTIGIDIQDICVGTFICDLFIKVHNDTYWENVEQIIRDHAVRYIFVTAQHEICEWSQKKEYFSSKYACTVLLNDISVCEIASCKQKTFDFCKKHDIRVPDIKTITDRPIIIKPNTGCGSKDIQILKNSNDQPYPFTDCIIQEYIDGDEYTVDVIADPNGQISSIIPKKRCLVKNGQSFKSITVYNKDVIAFVKNVSLLLGNKCVINVQVIVKNETVYLIEINPRFSTTITLSIEAGVNIPKMLIERDFTERICTYDLLMVRDYKEYFYTKKQRIFLTGGAGFIGSNIIKCLIDEYDITVYDNLSTTNGGDINIRNEHRIRFIKGDILDTKHLFEAMKNHDIVIHMAAQLEVTLSYDNPISDVTTNLIGTINVIEGCKKNGIKRLINASSACVYGFTDGTPSKETDETNPNWEYGASKLAAEKYIQIASASHGIRTTSLRFSIVYGENEWYGRVLTLFTKRFIQGDPLVIFGNGTQTRDFIHVSDVARFVKECICNPVTHNKCYNVSSGTGLSLNDLSKKFVDACILYENIKEGDISEHVPGRVRLCQELTHLILDNTKAITETKWSPLVSFDDGLKTYIEWARKNIHLWNTFKV